MIDTKAVERIIENFDDGEGQWYTWKYASKAAPVQLDDLGTVEVVESEGGGEGEGEHVHIVFRVTFPSGDVRYFKKEAYYASYDGITWDDGDFFEVAGHAKVVTLYERVRP